MIKLVKCTLYRTWATQWYGNDCLINDRTVCLVRKALRNHLLWQMNCFMLSEQKYFIPSEFHPFLYLKASLSAQKFQDGFNQEVPRNSGFNLLLLHYHQRQNRFLIWGYKILCLIIISATRMIIMMNIVQGLYFSVQ